MAGLAATPGPRRSAWSSPIPTGSTLEQFGERIGVATNNVAEYRAVLRGLERARALGATEVELIGDSELVARQLSGPTRSSTRR